MKQMLQNWSLSPSGIILIASILIPLVQIVFIRKLDLARWLWGLSIIMGFFSALATLMAFSLVRNEIPVHDREGIFYIYGLFAVNLATYIIKKRYFGKSKPAPSELGQDK